MQFAFDAPPVQVARPPTRWEIAWRWSKRVFWCAVWLGGMALWVVTFVESTI